MTRPLITFSNNFIQTSILLTVLLFSSHPIAASQYTGKYAVVDKATLAQRKLAVMKRNVDKPWPALDNDAGIANYALSSYTLNYKTEKADEIIQNINFGTGELNNYFWSAPIIRVFADAKLNVNMSQVAYDHLAQQCLSVVKLTPITSVTTHLSIGGSENIGAKKRSLQYLCALQLSKDPNYQDSVLPDGASLADHARAWGAYWKNYFRTYARQGLETEMNSPTYIGYTLGPYSNVYDLTDDPELKALAKQYFDLMFADKAQMFNKENGRLGGAKSRAYRDNYLLGDGFSLYVAKFGWQDKAISNHPRFAASLASSYAVPDVVTDIALNKRGYAEVENGWWGNTGGTPPEGFTQSLYYQWLDLDDQGRGGAIRQSTVNDAFIMGTAYYSPFMTPTSVLSQNRKMGIYINATGPVQELFVNGLGTEQNRQTGYREITGVNANGAQVIWRDTHVDRNTGTRVYATTDLYNNAVKNGAWWFSQYANAYVAFRVAQGGWQETDEHALGTGKYFILDNLNTPVIMEAANKADYDSFEAFQAAIKDNVVEIISNDHVRYTSEAGDVFDVYPQQEKIAQINGKSVLYRHAETYHSPFIKGMGPDKDRVLISSPSGEKLLLNFANDIQRFEAECSAETGWDVKDNPSASGNRYAVANGSGALKFKFNVPADGVYNLYANTLAPSGAQNSFYVQVDDGARASWSLAKSSNFVWHRFAQSFALTAGLHTLIVTPREQGTGIDQLVLSQGANIKQDTVYDCADIWLQPKFGEIGSHWEVKSSVDASSVDYLYAPQAINKASEAITTKDIVRLPFVAKRSGSYFLQMRNLSPTGADNSVFVRVNGTDWQLFSFATNGRFKWDTYATPFALTAGNNVVEVAIREGGTSIDKLRFSLNKSSLAADDFGAVVLEQDSDNDGVPDSKDAFPNDATETTDSDGDGVGDNGDDYPNDASESKDSDGDGLGDNQDPMPNAYTSAQQSSTGSGGEAIRAIDGNTSGVWKNSSVTHTSAESNPWWQQDLGAVKSVASVTLFNRTDCCSERLKDVHVFVSDNDMTGRSLDALKADNTVAQAFHAGEVTDKVTLNLGDQAKGRYVRVQLAGSGILSLAEVQVSAKAVEDNSPLLALPSYPHHSSTILVEKTNGVERIWNVNPDNNSVSVMDKAGNLVKEIAVGNRPWSLAKSPTSNHLLVSNKGSDSISEIDTEALEVINTLGLSVDSQPHGIVYNHSGSDYYVLHSGTKILAQYKSSSHQMVNSRALNAESRHLSLRPDGSMLIVSQYIGSGLQDAGNINVSESRVPIKAYSPTDLREIGVVNLSSDTAHNYVGTPIVSYDNAAVYIPSRADHTQAANSSLGGTLNRISLTDGSVTATKLANSDHANSATVTGDNRHLIIVLEGKQQLVVYDTTSQSEVLRLATGRAPQGVALSQDGQVAYVHNYLDRSVTRYDLVKLVNGGGAPQTTTVVTTESLSAEALAGKQLMLYGVTYWSNRDDVACGSCDAATASEIATIREVIAEIKQIQTQQNVGLREALQQFAGGGITPAQLDQLDAYFETIAN